MLIPVHLTSLHHLQTLFRAAHHPTNKSASLAITHNTTLGCLTITRLWPILTGIQEVTSRKDKQALPCLWVLATSGTMFLMTGTSNTSVKSGHRWKTMICYELVYITTAIHNVNGKQYIHLYNRHCKKSWLILLKCVLIYWFI